MSSTFGHQQEIRARLTGGRRASGGTSRTWDPAKSVITVVTVVYNAANTLEATLQSVFDQRYDSIEYIVIDGGSTDGSLDIIRKHDQKIDLWISEPDKGIYDAMNKGIDLATGEWINFMNSGDRFASADALTFFERPFNADVVYGDAEIEYPGFTKAWKNTDISNLWKRMAFCHQACFVKTAAIRTLKFDLSYRVSADFNQLYTLYQQGKKFEYVDTLICYYDFKEGISKNMAVRSILERKRAVLSFGFSFRKWIFYILSVTYVFTALWVKKILGPNLSAWLTRLAKA